MKDLLQRRSGHWLIFPICLVSRRITFWPLSYCRNCWNVKILTGNSSSLLLTTAMPATYNSISRLWRCNPSCSYSCIWSPVASGGSSGHSVLSRWIPLVKSGTGKKARPYIIPQNSLKSSSFL
jgi:hypothetical protein